MAKKFSKPAKIGLYGDESSQNNHHYMVLGFVVIPKNHADSMRDAVLRSRPAKHRTQEIKWSKTCTCLFSEYKAITDLFFNKANENKCHFHSMVVDCHQLNNQTYNQGDEELTINKLSYQLLVKCGRFYGEKYRLYAYMDQRCTVHRPDELMEIVNNGLGSRWNIYSRPYKRCVRMASKKSTLIQLADLLIGAIAFHKNRRDELSTTREAKIELANHIAKRCGVSRLGADTPMTQKRFTVWNFRLRN